MAKADADLNIWPNRRISASWCETSTPAIVLEVKKAEGMRTMWHPMRSQSRCAVGKLQDKVTTFVPHRSMEYHALGISEFLLERATLFHCGTRSSRTIRATSELG